MAFNLFINSILSLFLEECSKDTSIIFFKRATGQVTTILFVFPITCTLLLPTSTVESKRKRCRVISPLCLSHTKRPILVVNNTRLEFSITSSKDNVSPYKDPEIQKVSSCFLISFQAMCIL